MPKDPKVSIIVPVKDTAAYLETCIDSALSQGFSDFELLCVDDASKDGSETILERAAAGDGRIHVISGHFGGPSAARNAALDHARGTYIACLDSDDFWPAGALGTMVEKAEDSGADMVLFDYWLYFGAGRDLSVYRDQETFARLDGVVAPALEIPELFGMAGVWDRLFKRSFLKEHRVRFVEGRLYEDAMFSLEALAANPVVAVTAEHLYYYRRQVADSITYTEDAGLKHKEDFAFAQSYIRAKLAESGLTNEAWTSYARYFAEYSYMHNREVAPYSAFRDFFEAMRMIACAPGGPCLFELWEDDPNPGRAAYIACVDNDQPRRAYAIAKAANAAGRVLHRR